MMSFLYLTADVLGTPTGGGVVTANEYAALCELARLSDTPVECLSPRGSLNNEGSEPWKWDTEAYISLFLAGRTQYPKLCHVYSGTWPTTIAELRRRGCKVAITIAAHDRHISRREHEALGLSFPYPHLIEEPLWQRYIEGYRQADVIVCPSWISAATVRKYGSDFAGKDIRVIPHGCYLPADNKPPLRIFTVGYLGSYGADKGVRYLLEAWKKLDYKDAVLMLGGRDSTHPWVNQFIQQYGGGSIWQRGWIDNVSDFYNDCSVYVQPSATEGFGIEVLEAMVHGCPTLCSTAAGAQDVVPVGFRFPPCDVDALATAIDSAWRLCKSGWQTWGWCERASGYTWDTVKEQYKKLWKEMLQ